MFCSLINGPNNISKHQTSEINEIWNFQVPIWHYSTFYDLNFERRYSEETVTPRGDIFYIRRYPAVLERVHVLINVLNV